MGSLRNPVGPLPSSIYWRRRVVLLSVLALLALLIAWIATSGGGGGGNHAGGSNGKNPAPSITPGPSGSGPAITEHPGGRDESSGGDSDGSGSGGGSASGGTGSGGSGGPDGTAGGDTGASGGGSDDGANGSDGGDGGTGAVLPAGSTLPNCTPGAVSLSLNSVRNTYAPDQTPTFRLVAKNSSGSDCKVDLGPRSAVVTITQAGGDDPYWSSSDCPKGAGRLLYRVPAKSSITYLVKWDRKPSAPECGTPPAGSAKPGTYLVEAKAPGYAKTQTSFVLAAD
ncbi:hypothetical protein [Streptomyces griseosporeus]|uniref:hypothetical protein n=1 Tax=Streptomyces griseosporeus TaxID=1910 RepID=UPI00167D102A|nr:hypothetical protein [Streptomyces griseosporeus]GHF76688.1 hypothetical protein GCM10018783_53760 [Streptomyces griseosporeus]